MNARNSSPALPQRLVADFGAASRLARQLVAGLCAELSAGKMPALLGASPEVAAAIAQCRRDAASVYGGFDAGSPAVAALAKSYGLPLEGTGGEEILVAVWTYYALLVQALVRHVAPGAALSDGSEVGQASCLSPVGQASCLSVRAQAGSPCYGKAEPVDRLADRLGSYDRTQLVAAYDAGHDLLQDLYQAIFPRPFRHAAGEYYTPPWLAEELLDEVGYPGPATTWDDLESRPTLGLRLLDPACGSGTFLILAIRRLRLAVGRLSKSSHPEGKQQPPESAGLLGRETLLDQILASVVGFDRNPLAVLTARANYLLALGDLLPGGPIQVPVYCRDSILGSRESRVESREERFHLSTLDSRLSTLDSQLSTPDSRPFDVVVGNPPWIAWDNLPAGYREATKPLWRQYGLFSLSGTEARHGGGKKDLSMLMTYVAADRYLKDSGRLAMVITQTVFQSKGAGDGFRRFRLGADGPWLRVLRVNDLVALRPFRGAANWTATILLEKGGPTAYPVPYVRWLPGSCQERYEASPVDPQRNTSPWFLWPQGWKDPKGPLIGPSDYRAHLGANSGGANGVYWVTLVDRVESRESRVESGELRGKLPTLDFALSTLNSPLSTLDSPLSTLDLDRVRVRNVPARGKHSLPSVEHLVEAELLFPLLRWADVSRWRAVPRGYWLFVQDVHTRKGIEEERLRRHCPDAYAYLEQFRGVLSGRAAYRRYQLRAAFYSMYDVGPYTLAPIKVVWRRMDRRVNAAVVEPRDDPVLGPRPVIPQETCVLIAAESPDEAHYLCALLNSATVGFLVSSHSVRGGKGFGTPSMLDFLRLRRFDPQDAAHLELAALSREAHQRAARGEDTGDIERRIDRAAGRLWGFDP